MSSSLLAEVFKQPTGQFWGVGGRTQVGHDFREPPQLSGPGVSAALGRGGTQERVVRSVLLGPPALDPRNLSEPLLWGPSAGASGHALDQPPVPLGCFLEESSPC